MKITWHSGKLLAKNTGRVFLVLCLSFMLVFNPVMAGVGPFLAEAGDEGMDDSSHGLFGSLSSYFGVLFGSGDSKVTIDSLSDKTYEFAGEILFEDERIRDGLEQTMTGIASENGEESTLEEIVLRILEDEDLEGMLGEVIASYLLLEEETREREFVQQITYDIFQLLQDDGDGSFKAFFRGAVSDFLEDEEVDKYIGDIFRIVTTRFQGMVDDLEEQNVFDGIPALLRSFAEDLMDEITSDEAMANIIFGVADNVESIPEAYSDALENDENFNRAMRNYSSAVRGEITQPLLDLLEVHLEEYLDMLFPPRCEAEDCEGLGECPDCPGKDEGVWGAFRLLLDDIMAVHMIDCGECGGSGCEDCDHTGEEPCTECPDGTPECIDTLGTVLGELVRSIDLNIDHYAAGATGGGDSSCPDWCTKQNPCSGYYSCYGCEAEGQMGDFLMFWADNLFAMFGEPEFMELLMDPLSGYFTEGAGERQLEDILAQLMSNLERSIDLLTDEESPVADSIRINVLYPLLGGDDDYNVCRNESCEYYHKNQEEPGMCENPECEYYNFVPVMEQFYQDLFDILGDLVGDIRLEDDVEEAAAALGTELDAIVKSIFPDYYEDPVLCENPECDFYGEECLDPGCDYFEGDIGIEVDTDTIDELFDNLTYIASLAHPEQEIPLHELAGDIAEYMQMDATCGNEDCPYHEEVCEAPDCEYYGLTNAQKIGYGMASRLLGTIVSAIEAEEEQCGPECTEEEPCEVCLEEIRDEERETVRAGLLNLERLENFYGDLRIPLEGTGEYEVTEESDIVGIIWAVVTEILDEDFDLFFEALEVDIKELIEDEDSGIVYYGRRLGAAILGFMDRFFAPLLKIVSPRRYVYDYDADYQHRLMAMLSEERVASSIRWMIDPMEGALTDAESRVVNFKDDLNFPDYVIKSFLEHEDEHENTGLGIIATPERFNVINELMAEIFGAEELKKLEAGYFAEDVAATPETLENLVYRLDPGDPDSDINTVSYINDMIEDFIEGMLECHLCEGAGCGECIDGMLEEARLTLGDWGGGVDDTAEQIEKIGYMLGEFAEECRPCGGDGIVDEEPCDYCDGTGSTEIDCRSCEGSGCTECDNSGKTRPSIEYVGLLAELLDENVARQEFVTYMEAHIGPSVEALADTLRSEELRLLVHDLVTDTLDAAVNGAATVIDEILQNQNGELTYITETVAEILTFGGLPGQVNEMIKGFLEADWIGHVDMVTEAFPFCEDHCDECHGKNCWADEGAPAGETCGDYEGHESSQYELVPRDARDGNPLGTNGEGLEYLLRLSVYYSVYRGYPHSDEINHFNHENNMGHRSSNMPTGYGQFWRVTYREEACDIDFYGNEIGHAANNGMTAFVDPLMEWLRGEGNFSGSDPHNPRVLQAPSEFLPTYLENFLRRRLAGEFVPNLTEVLLNVAYEFLSYEDPERGGFDEIVSDWLLHALYKNPEDPGNEAHPWLLGEYADIIEREYTGLDPGDIDPALFEQNVTNLLKDHLIGKPLDENMRNLELLDNIANVLKYDPHDPDYPVPVNPNDHPPIWLLEDHVGITFSSLFIEFAEFLRDGWHIQDFETAQSDGGDVYLDFTLAEPVNPGRLTIFAPCESCGECSAGNNHLCENPAQTARNDEQQPCGECSECTEGNGENCEEPLGLFTGSLVVNDPVRNSINYTTFQVELSINGSEGDELVTSWMPDLMGALEMFIDADQLRAALKIERDCPPCGGTGDIDGTECEDCDGTGKQEIMDCTACDGSGDIDGETCERCGGSGEHNMREMLYENILKYALMTDPEGEELTGIECLFCHGEGCDFCDGGVITESAIDIVSLILDEEVLVHDCVKCGGEGDIDGDVCADCEGSGEINVSRAFKLGYMMEDIPARFIADLLTKKGAEDAPSELAQFSGDVVTGEVTDTLLNYGLGGRILDLMEGLVKSPALFDVSAETVYSFLGNIYKTFVRRINSFGGILAGSGSATIQTQRFTGYEYDEIMLKTIPSAGVDSMRDLAGIPASGNNLQLQEVYETDAPVAGVSSVEVSQSGFKVDEIAVALIKGLERLDTDLVDEVLGELLDENRFKEDTQPVIELISDVVAHQGLSGIAGGVLADNLQDGRLAEDLQFLFDNVIEILEHGDMNITARQFLAALIESDELQNYVDNLTTESIDIGFDMLVSMVENILLKSWPENPSDPESEDIEIVKILARDFISQARIEFEGYEGFPGYEKQFHDMVTDVRFEELLVFIGELLIESGIETVLRIYEDSRYQAAFQDILVVTAEYALAGVDRMLSDPDLTGALADSIDSGIRRASHDDSYSFLQNSVSDLLTNLLYEDRALSTYFSTAVYEVMRLAPGRVNTGCCNAGDRITFGGSDNIVQLLGQELCVVPPELINDAIFNWMFWGGGHEDAVTFAETAEGVARQLSPELKDQIEDAYVDTQIFMMDFLSDDNQAGMLESIDDALTEYDLNASVDRIRADIRLLTDTNDPDYPGEYYREITVNHEDISENEENFPVRVLLDSANFDFDKARNDGHDIRFTCPDGERLVFQRVSHDAGGQSAEYRVLLPEVFRLEDVSFYIYYGNPDAADQSTSVAAPHSPGLQFGEKRPAYLPLDMIESMVGILPLEELGTVLDLPIYEDIVVQKFEGADFTDGWYTTEGDYQWEISEKNHDGDGGSAVFNRSVPPLEYETIVSQGFTDSMFPPAGWGVDVVELDVARVGDSWHRHLVGIDPNTFNNEAASQMYVNDSDWRGAVTDANSDGTYPVHVILNTPWFSFDEGQGNLQFTYRMETNEAARYGNASYGVAYRDSDGSILTDELGTCAAGTSGTVNVSIPEEYAGEGIRIYFDWEGEYRFSGSSMYYYKWIIENVNISGWVEQSPDFAEGTLYSGEFPVEEDYVLEFYETSEERMNYIYHALGIETSGGELLYLNELGRAPTYPEWSRYRMDLDDYAGETIRVFFHYEGAGADTWYIDDFMVRGIDDYEDKEHVFDELERAGHMAVDMFPLQDVIDEVFADEEQLKNALDSFLTGVAEDVLDATVQSDLYLAAVGVISGFPVDNIVGFLEEIYDVPCGECDGCMESGECDIDAALDGLTRADYIGDIIPSTLLNLAADFIGRPCGDCDACNIGNEEECGELWRMGDYIYDILHELIDEFGGGSPGKLIMDVLLDILSCGECDACLDNKPCQDSLLIPLLERMLGKSDDEPEEGEAEIQEEKQDIPQLYQNSSGYFTHLITAFYNRVAVWMGMDAESGSMGSELDGAEIQNEEPDVINIPDDKLREAVKYSLLLNSMLTGTDKPSDEITADDMLKLYSFSATRRGIEDLTGLEHAANLRHLDLYGNEISEISVLASLTELESLHLANNHIESISHLSGLTNLKELDLSSNDGISNLSSLENLENLEALNLSANNISSVSYLSGLTELKRLNLGDNAVNFNDNANTNAFKELVNLRNLDLSGNPIPAGNALSFLRDLENVRSLKLSQTNIDIDDLVSTVSGQRRDLFLKDMENLAELDLSGNNFTDLGSAWDDMGSLTDLASLKTLNLADNDITDGHLEEDWVEWENLSALETLDLSANNISNPESLPALSALTKLNLSGNNIDDLSFVSGMENISYLYLAGNSIEELNHLEGMEFKELDLSHNDIDNIAPLAEVEFVQFRALIRALLRLGADFNLDALEFGLEFFDNIDGGGYLDLSGNDISDITPLAGKKMQSLDLSGNHLDKDDLADILDINFGGILGGGMLDLSGNEIDSLEAWRDEEKQVEHPLTLNVYPHESLRSLDVMLLGDNYLGDGVHNLNSEWKNRRPCGECAACGEGEPCENLYYTAPGSCGECPACQDPESGEECEEILAYKDFRDWSLLYHISRKGAIVKTGEQNPRHEVPAGIMGGEISDSEGAPLAGAEVTVRETEDGTELQEEAGKTYYTTTGADGTYRLPLPAGTYNIEIRSDGYRPFMQEQVVIKRRSESDSGRSREINVDAVLRTMTIGLKITDTEGRLLDNARITAWLEDGEHYHTAGGHELPVSPGTYRIEITCDGYLPVTLKDITIDEEGSVEGLETVEMELITLNGKAKDIRGNPLEDVSIFALHDNLTHIVEGVTRKDGSYTLGTQTGLIKPGIYRLELEKPGYLPAVVEALVDGDRSLNVDPAVLQLYGDVTNSGEPELADAILTLRHIVGITVLDDEALARALISGGETLSISDAIQILRRVAGLTP